MQNLANSKTKESCEKETKIMELTSAICVLTSGLKLLTVRQREEEETFRQWLLTLFRCLALFWIRSTFKIDQK